jgi:hypothetical protein
VPDEILLAMLSFGAFTHTVNYLFHVLHEFAVVIDINIFKLGPRE